MSQPYQAPDGSPSPKLSLLLGLVAALLIFLLVPLSQWFRPQRPQMVEPLQSVSLSPPPPPAPETPPPPAPAPEAAPQLQAPPPLPDLQQLELSLQPGMGAQLSVEVGLDLDFQTESAQQLAELFDFEQLDQVPHLLRRGEPRMPQPLAFTRLMRQNVLKQVTLVVVVDERGAVRVTEVLSASHEALIPAAKQAAERSRFSPPTVQGQPVRAKYTWLLTF